MSKGELSSYTLYMHAVATDVYMLRSLSVCLSVDHRVTSVSPAKTAEPTKMMYEEQTRVGLKNQVPEKVLISATWRIKLNDQKRQQCGQSYHNCSNCNLHANQL